MKTLGSIFGFLIICASMLMFLMAVVLADRPQAPTGLVALSGLVALILGMALARLSRNK
jgi:hypothetical protein